jgi:hypothetical protein
MVRDSVSVEINASCEAVFDLIHDYERRLTWDSMLSEARILGGATVAGKGVRTLCVGTWRGLWLPMETEYVSFERGRVAAVKLTNRPPFFDKFAATIRHETVADLRSKVTYIYSFQARPAWLGFILNPVMNIALRHEVQTRLQSLKFFMESSAL